MEFPKEFCKSPKKVDDLFYFFAFSLNISFITRLYIQHFVFNCKFFVASLTDIRVLKQKIFFTFQKGAGMQNSFKIYITKKISSLQKRCWYAVPARTVTKSPGKQFFGNSI